MDFFLNKGDKIVYEKYWDRDGTFTAEVIDIEDTIFQPADERTPEEMVYTVRDLSTGEKFILSDDEYWFEILSE